MTHSDLAELIRSKFTPFAFSCECNGSHESCARVRYEDTYSIAQADTVARIARFIESLEG